VSSVVENVREDQRTDSGSAAASTVDHAGALLADEHIPVTVIERRTGWRLFDLGELWRYRELLFFLAWRDIRVRYKQTVIGASWTVLQPLATMAVFAYFFGRVAARNADPVPYPLFVFAGLLPWMFFTGAVNSASTSVVGNERMLTKVYFPRLLVPLASVLAIVLDFLIGFGLLLLMMPFPFFHTLPGWGFLLVPVVVLVMVIFALGLGVFLSAVNVAYRDFRVIVPLALQLWMLATPILYLQNYRAFLGPRQQAVLMFNPLHGIIVNFRAAVLRQDFDWPALGFSALVGVLALLIGCFYFRRVESGFADII
jgi:lipopolysaccharide transport system permease protein